MDMKTFFSRIREVEAAITEKDAVIVSEATPDGGRAGVLSEVPRSVAARLVAEGRARLALAEEAAEYRAQIAAEYHRAEEARRLAKPALAVLSEGELKTLQSALNSRKRQG